MPTLEITNTNGSVERVEISSFMETQVRALIAGTPIPQIMTGMESAQEKQKREAYQKYSEFAREQQKRVGEAQGRVSKLKDKHAQTLAARKALSSTGDFSEATQLALKLAELDRDIIEAERDYAYTVKSASGDRMNYLENLVKGPLGGEIGGVDYKNFYNGTRADLKAWYERMSQDIPAMFTQSLEDAKDLFARSSIWLVEAEENLAAHVAKMNGEALPEVDQATGDFLKKWGIRPSQHASKAQPQAQPAPADNGKSGLDQLLSVSGRIYGKASNEAARGIQGTPDNQPAPQIQDWPLGGRK